ncbi:cell division protein SepF [Oceanivirga miroungae]|uniref:Cell division protein SepF n=1 Tax=Oceanivirga miroungae TaxID=1130046 RepID=A0A6I8MDG8_9FUSO|nr:cell division protein SepF [Oceanivirga miroungae]VWL85140.1 Cell division protein SepF [Oceanivirga miroungae]
MAVKFGKFINNESGEETFDFGLKIIRPLNYSSGARKIAELIKQKNIVAFNLENLSSEEAQRTYDFILGATTVLGGRIEKITDKVYASIPASISVENLEEKEEQIEE